MSMELRALLERARLLRAQITEMQQKLASTQAELARIDAELDRATRGDGRALADLSEEEFQSLLAEFNDPRQITVEVVYATPARQRVEEVQLSLGATIEDGILVSGILDQFPEVDLDTFKVGIHGVIRPLGHKLENGNRIEIYRPVGNSGKG
jgi:putative ubiquitin-RnfH superfamily antitoxin RatB of RatAB toxin-antitoxin module